VTVGIATPTKAPVAPVVKPNGSQAEGFVALHSLPDVRAMDRRKVLRELVPIWKLKGDVQRIVRMVFEYHQPDVDALHGVLFEQARLDYGAAMAAEARAAGYPVQGVRVFDQRVLADLDRRANFASRSIATTYNRDLRREIGRIAADAPKGNRWVFAKRLDAWEKGRASWKAEQIAYSEMGETINQAQMDFVHMNGLAPRARVVPETGQCAYCEELAGEGWMDFATAEGLGLPAHPGCIHSLELDYDTASLPPLGDLFVGGQLLLGAAAEPGVGGKPGGLPEGLPEGLEEVE